MDGERRHKRFETYCETEFVANGHICKGTSVDFSLNGLFIKTNRPLAPGSVIDITVYLKDGLTSQLKGRVRRAMRTSRGISGMGIEIIGRDINYSRFITSCYIQHTKSLLT